MLLRISLDLPNDAHSVPLCRRSIHVALQGLSVPEDRAFEIELALSEAAGNVVRHAYENPGNRYFVTVEVFPARVRLFVEDHGQGFARADVPEPDVEQTGGRGLWIIEHLADIATFRSLPGGGSLLEADFILPGPLIAPADPASALLLEDPVARKSR